jgi:hypothetical protein
MDNRKLAAIPQWFQRLQLRMQREAAIEVNRAVGSSGSRYSNTGPDVVVTLFEERDDNVEAISRAPLEDRDQDLSFAIRGSCGTSEPGRRDPETGHDDCR